MLRATAKKTFLSENVKVNMAPFYCFGPLKTGLGVIPNVTGHIQLKFIKSGPVRLN